MMEPAEPSQIEDRRLALLGEVLPPVDALSKKSVALQPGTTHVGSRSSKARSRALRMYLESVMTVDTSIPLVITSSKSASPSTARAIATETLPTPGISQTSPASA